MNVKLLRKVARHIAAEPIRFCGSWYMASCHLPCGTRACIAGWAVILGNRMKPEEIFTLDTNTIRAKAEKLLRINADQSRRLFINWPSPWPSIHDSNAQTAVKRIEHFIKTKGKE